MSRGDGDSGDASGLERVLAERVFDGTDYRPFAELTAGQVRARATELREAAGFGPTQRVASVAAVWEGLAEAMEREAAETVADLDEATLAARADRLWVIPPGGSFL